MGRKRFSGMGLAGWHANYSTKVFDIMIKTVITSHPAFCSFSKVLN